MGLGFLDIAIATIDAMVMGVTKTIEYDDVKDYGKKRVDLQRDLQQSQLANKAKETALRMGLLSKEGETSLLEDRQIRRVVGLGTASAVGLVLLAFALIFMVRKK